MQTSCVSIDVQGLLSYWVILEENLKTFGIMGESDPFLARPKKLDLCLSHESLTVFWFLNFHGIDWTAISTTTHAWYNLSVCNEKWCWRLLKLLKSEWFKNSSVDMYSIINSDMALASAAFGFYKVSLFCMTWLYSDRILVSFLQML